MKTDHRMTDQLLADIAEYAAMEGITFASAEFLANEMDGGVDYIRQQIVAVQP